MHITPTIIPTIKKLTDNVQLGKCFLPKFFICFSRSQ